MKLNHGSVTLRHIGAALLAATSFFVLSDVADYWGGGLRPNPLWLATSSTTALALAIPMKYRWTLVAGGAIGCVIAGLLLFDETLLSLALPCLGNTTESAIAIALARRAFTWELSLGRTRRAVAWIFSSVLAAFCGGVIATLNSSSEVVGERMESLLRWTLGDSVGLLLLPPLVVAFRSPWIPPIYSHWRAEIAASLAALGLLVVLSFQSVASIPYVLAPVIMWIGIRFGPRLAVPAAFVSALSATYLTAEGYGPFAEEGVDAVVQVQALNVALALSALVASAHAVRSWRDQQRLRATLEAIPDVVVTRDSFGRAVSAWGPKALREEVSRLEGTTIAPSDDPLVEVEFSDSEPELLAGSPGHFIEHRSVAVEGELSLHFYRDVSVERRAAQERHDLFIEIEDARLETREALARDLHDGPIQSLAASRLYLEAGSDFANADPELFNKVLGCIDDAAAHLREALDGLVVSPDDAAPAQALNAFGGDVLAAVGIDLEIVDRTNERRFDEGIEQALVLIGREAILNAARHSGGTLLRIDLDTDGRAVKLVVADDGNGFDPNHRSPGIHLGVSSMKSRAVEVGGTVDVQTSSGTGTSVCVDIPL